MRVNVLILPSTVLTFVLLNEEICHETYLVVTDREQ